MLEHRMENAMGQSYRRALSVKVYYDSDFPGQLLRQWRGPRIPSPSSDCHPQQHPSRLVYAAEDS